jgi:CBS domain containing-hemolysin-like protein
MNTPRLLTHSSTRAATPALLALMLFAPTRARASLLHGDALDSLANGISWVAIIIAPIIGIVIFWLVHILPEKIAHKKKHPQTHAIQCLCLLSLVFGGLLWPIAWLWAYSKPVLYRLAYGTDVDESLAHDESSAHHDGREKIQTTEVEQLRARVAELEAQAKGGKA